MPRHRTFALAALLAAGLAVTATAQPDRDRLSLPNNLRNAVNNFKGTDRNLTGAGLDAARRSVDEFAKLFVDFLASPRTYKGLGEFKGGDSPAEDALEQFVRFLHIPGPGTKLTFENHTYIRELGAAVDKHVQPAILSSPDPIVRVNETRLLAAAARSGAAAHGPTITALIRNDAAPGEVKFYALKAAENLLSAYSIEEVKRGQEPRAHTLKPEELVALVSALEDAVTNPAKLVGPQVAGQTPEEQAAVLQYIRRQAVRALAQVRFASVEDRQVNPLVRYPAYTLARVATGDPTLTPPVTPSEVAEAVTGLGNMAATPGYRLDVAADAAATGVIRFADARQGVDDKSTPWKVYAARMANGLGTWAGLVRDLPSSRSPKTVADLAAVATRSVLDPLAAGGAGAAKLKVEDVRSWQTDHRKTPGMTGKPALFENAPAKTAPTWLGGKN